MSRTLSVRPGPNGYGARAFLREGLWAQCDLALLRDTYEQNYIQVRRSDFPRTVFVARPDETALALLRTLLAGVDDVVIYSSSDDRTIPRQVDCRWAPFPPSVEDGILALLQDGTARCWFAENIDSSIPGLYPLPGGVKIQPWAGDMRRMRSLDSLDQRVGLLVAHRNRQHPQFSLRQHVSDAATSWPSTTVLKEEVSGRFFDRLLRRHEFVACVHGGGLDPSPKAWQGLLHGCVPVIETSPLTRAYADLPVIVIESWYDLDVTESLLAAWRVEAESQVQALGGWTEVQKRLTLDWWTTKTLEISGYGEA